VWQICAAQYWLLTLLCDAAYMPVLYATYSAEAERKRGNEMSDVQKFGEEFQRAGKDGFDASVRSLGEWNKGFQAIAATVADYSKKSFEDGTRAFEQLVGVKSVEQAWEIQSQYAKKAFDAYVAHASKLSEMYVDLARNAYRPVEQATAKAARKIS
jgi:hypothetical protein